MATEKFTIKCYGSGLDVYGDEWEIRGGNTQALHNDEAVRGMQAKCPRCDRWIGVLAAGIMADETRLRSHSKTIVREVRTATEG